MGNYGSRSTSSMRWPSNVDDLLSAFEKFSDSLILDSSRREFAQLTLSCVFELENFSLRGNGHCRLLLGRQGIGKTVLLRQLMTFCGGTRNVLCVFLTGAQQQIELPSDAIAESLGIAVPKHAAGRKRIQSLITELSRRNKSVFLVVDELQEIYKSPDVLAGRFIDELLEIGDSVDGRVHCVITGSSTDLRKLVYSKISMEEAKSYPAYRRINLNSMKFSPVSISPFLDKAAVAATLAIANPRRMWDDESLLRCLLVTGGYPRLIERFSRGDPVDESVVLFRTVTGNPFTEPLNRLCAHLKQECSVVPRASSIELIAYLGTWVSVSSLSQPTPLSKHTLYDMADAGLIEFEYSENSRIRLLSPRVFMEYQLREHQSESG